MALLGTMLELVGLLWLNNYNLFLIVVNVLEIPLMLFGIIGKTRGPIFCLIITGYFFLMLINSVVELLWNWFGETASFLLLLIFACGAVVAGVRIWRNHTKMQKGIFTVEIQHEGEAINVQGFYDSGNRLIDPYTGNGVHIVSGAIATRLGLNQQTAVLVPYQALGSEDGIVEVYYADEIKIEGERQSIHLQKCPLGVTKDNLFEGKKYEIILNEEVF